MMRAIGKWLLLTLLGIVAIAAGSMALDWWQHGGGRRKWRAWRMGWKVA